MHKLLVPFDGSDPALRALRHAITRVREGDGGSVHLVHAHPEPRIYGEIEIYVSAEKMAELQRSVSETLLAAAEAVLKEAGVPYTKDVLVGHLGQVIADHADALGCDGIVMGTRGSGALGGLLLGSVATKVIHSANVPVTLVK
jgi:nucleotide-binding universal stress UspA family protein